MEIDLTSFLPLHQQPFHGSSPICMRSSSSFFLLNEGLPKHFLVIAKNKNSISKKILEYVTLCL